MRGETPYSRRALAHAMIAVMGLALVFVTVAPVHALPVFARKYHTSCQTCHTVFPKLNPFGEAFRLRGYRLPSETEAQVKEKPVSLGAEAYKRVWPDAVYPSDLPGGAPLAINVKMANVYASSKDDSGHQVTHNDFQFPQEANIFSAGTLGDHFSFFGEFTFGETSDGGTETEIEHAQLHVNSPFGPENLVNFKVGKFSPDLEDRFQEMWLMTDNGVDTLFAYNPIGLHGGTGLEEDVGISLPSLVKGIEMYGIAHHRLFYTVGVTNGLGPGPNDTVDGNNSKDVWARIDYKFGGMGLDGDTTGVTLPPENWREKSLRVGLLGYSGDGSGIDFPVEDANGVTFNVQDRRYQRVGVFGSWIWNDLNLFGVALHGTDTLRVSDESGAQLDETKPGYDTWFLQADYVIKPPFQVSLRYEDLTPGDSSAPKSRFLNANFTFLMRANIKTMLEYRRDLEETQNYQLAAVLRFAY